MALKKQKKLQTSSKLNIPNKSLIGKQSRQRGHSYERKIVKELIEITGDEELKTSRRESKSLDDAKIDLYDGKNTLPFYCQMKATQATPQIKKINSEVGRKDKPLVIFWNAQEKRDKKQISFGEYCIVPKMLFYTLLKKWFTE